MALYIGSSQFTPYIGSTKCKYVYVGSTKIWPTDLYVVNNGASQSGYSWSYSIPGRAYSVSMGTYSIGSTQVYGLGYHNTSDDDYASSKSTVLSATINCKGHSNLIVRGACHNWGLNGTATDSSGDVVGNNPYVKFFYNTNGGSWNQTTIYKGNSSKGFSGTYSLSNASSCRLGLATFPTHSYNFWINYGFNTVLVQ